MPWRRLLYVSLSAGVAGAFCVILWFAILNFAIPEHVNPREFIDEILAIVLTAVGIWLVVEPFTERLAAALHIAAEHQSRITRPRAFQWKIFFLLAITSFTHALLHIEIRKQPEDATLYVVSTLLYQGGVTLLWLIGAHKNPSHAARFGLGILILCVPSALILYKHIKGHSPALFILMAPLLYYVAIAFLGGLSIDRRWGARPTKGILAVLVICSIFLGLVYLSFFLLFKEPKLAAEALTPIVGALGWGTALMIHPDADTLLRTMA